MRASREALVGAREQRAQHGGAADDDRVEVLRRELGTGVERAQHRVEGGRHREQQLGAGEEGEVLLGARAGVRAVRRHRPVRAGDERRDADHQLIGEHALARPDADLGREVGEPRAEARPGVHDGLRHVGGAGREDDEAASRVRASVLPSVRSAARCPYSRDRRRDSAPRGTPGSQRPVKTCRASGTRRAYGASSSPRRRASGRSGRDDARYSTDSAATQRGCGQRRARAEQRLARAGIGEDHHPAGVHDPEGQHHRIRARTHREQHPVAVGESLVPQPLPTTARMRRRAARRSASACRR